MTWRNIKPRLFGGFIVLFALALTSCAQQPPTEKPAQLPDVNTLHRHEDDAEHHEGELLVLDPPADYLNHLDALGLSIIDVTHLDGIGSQLYHMKIENNAHPFHARHAHANKFPNVVSDVHHHFESHATKRRKSDYTGRKATKWGTPKKGCGTGIHMGMVDGGVDTRHSAFKGRKITFRSFHLKGQTAAAISHGTAVASILVGSNKWGSLIPNAKLSAANVFHKNKKGQARASSKSILLAINWMIKQRVQVINFSIGGSANTLVRHAVKHAAKLGIVMVASAGNSGPFTKKKSYPAAYPEVIAIAASDPFNRVARFSSAGDYVEFTAPGVGIWSAVPGGGKAMSGTSFSSPIVAGYTAALMTYKGLKNTENIRAHFRQNAKARGKKKWDKYSGWGVVQIPQPC